MSVGYSINKILSCFGVKLSRVERKTWYVGNAADKVKTLIDVGTAYGTPYFYDVNTDASLFLLDPLVEYENHMKSILKNRVGSYEIVALGKEEKSLEINVQPDSPTKTTMLEHTNLTKTGNRIEQRTVPVKKLDDVVVANNLEPPFGIKIDAEGFELEIIKGAEKTLSLSSFVIAETSVVERFKNSYSFLEFLNEMERHGFKTANILSAKPDKLGVVRFMDILYTRDPIF